MGRAIECQERLVRTPGYYNWAPRDRGLKFGTQREGIHEYVIIRVRR